MNSTDRGEMGKINYRLVWQGKFVRNGIGNCYRGNYERGKLRKGRKMTRKK